MAWLRRDEGGLVESRELEKNSISALDSDIRLQMMKELSREPGYPADMSQRLDLPKQKTYYHFRILEQAGLIEKTGERQMSGGTASIYRPVSKSLHLDLGGDPERKSPPRDEGVEEFLKPLINEGELDGVIVAGSPDEHGPDQVRGRDGHLAGDIGAKLGTYAEASPPAVMLDTEVVSSGETDRNMVLIGGVLTNTISRKFNSILPVRFEGDNFPYRALESPEEEYTDSRIGVIQKARAPGNQNTVFQVAGIQAEGTRAAVRAFHELEELVDEAENYVVVRGKDMSGDGDIDDYEVVEKR